MRGLKIYYYQRRDAVTIESRYDNVQRVYECECSRLKIIVTHVCGAGRTQTGYNRFVVNPRRACAQRGILNYLIVHSIQSELNVLSKSVSNHQKLLEHNERETRANNIVIVGLKETEDENEDIIEKVNKIMEEKMNLSHTGIVKAHRLGKKGNSPSIPRPVLVLLLLRAKTKKRVTVVVSCVCMCVHSNLSPHTLESQKRDTNGFIAIQESISILSIFLKMLRSKVMAKFAYIPRTAPVS